MRNQVDLILEDIQSVQNGHEPDCSSITDKELLSVSRSKWPSVDGVATIPYTFVQKPFKALFDTVLAGIEPYLESSIPMKNISDYKMGMLALRFALNQLESLSKGRIKFLEDDHAEGGIRYFFSPKLSNATATLTYYAFTQILPDSSGYLNAALIAFPPNIFSQLFSTKRDDAQEALHVLLHESIHALGLLHVHENPAAAAKLRGISEGIFCSSTIYPTVISTVKSKYLLTGERDTTYRPVRLGSLDERWINLVYTDKVNTDYSYLISSLLMASSFSMLFHQAGENFLNKFFNKKFSALLTDSNFTAIAIIFEAPILAVLLFSLLALAKYYPKVSAQQKQNLTLLSLLSFNFSIAILGDWKLNVIGIRLFALVMHSFFYLTLEKKFNEANTFDRAYIEVLAEDQNEIMGTAAGHPNSFFQKSAGTNPNPSTEEHVMDMDVRKTI